MRMIKVASSNIEAVGWDPSDMDSVVGTLRVEFRNGAVYEYDGVPGPVFAELRDAASVGGYFHDRIKGQYTTRKVS